LFSQEFLNSLASAVADRVVARMAAENGPPRQRLFDIEHAARYIGRTAKAIEHLIARGTIPVSKLDGKRQIDRAALDKLIEDHTYYEC
jgi:hypothetical protein